MYGRENNKLNYFPAAIICLFILFLNPTVSNCQESIVNMVNGGTANNPATITVSFEGLEGNTYFTQCKQEIPVTIEICNLPEKGAFDFDRNYYDINFESNNIGDFRLRSTTPGEFKLRALFQAANIGACTTLRIILENNQDFFPSSPNPKDGNMMVFLSSSNPSGPILDIPSIVPQVEIVNPIGADGVTTLLSETLVNGPNVPFFGNFPAPSTACGGSLDAFYAIYGELVVDIDYCFNNVHLLMKPGSSIRITNGSLMTIDDRLNGIVDPNLMPCAGDAMWRGIIIEDGSLAMNETTISNAETAVTVLPDNSVSVTNSDFEDNFIGVRFMGDDNLSPPYNATVLGFFGNTFSGTGKLAPLYPGQILEFFNANDLPYAGVLAEDYNLLPLLGTRFPTDLKPTKYSNMNRGIRFINTDLNSSFSVFEDMRNDAIQGNSNNNNNFIHHGLNDDPSQPNNEQVDFLRCSNGIALTNMNAEIEDSHFLEIRSRGFQFFNCRNKNVSVKKNRVSVAGGGQGILSFFSHPLAGTIENNYFTPTNIDNGIDILCFEGFGSSSTPNPGNSWRINGNTFDGSEGGRTAIQVSGGSNFEIKDNTIFRSGNISGINKYGIRLTNSSFPELDCNDISLDGQNHGLDVGIMVRSSIFGEYECNSVDNYVNNIQFENDNMRNLFKGNQMLNGDQGLVFSSTAVIGGQDHKGNCWINNSNNDLSHASPDEVLVRRSLFTIKCLGEGNDENACGCDAVVSVQPTVSTEDLLAQEFFGVTESCDEKGEICSPKKFTPGTPIEPTVLSDRLNNLVYTTDNANSLNWMSQFNLLRAIDDGMLSANNQESEIVNLRRQNSELDEHLQFWSDISSHNVGIDENVGLSETFSNIHRVSLALLESTNDREQQNLQNQLDQLILEFETQKEVGNAISQSSTEALENIYSSYSFGAGTDELHLDYMAFVSNLYTEYMLNNNLHLDHRQEQYLRTIGTTCLDIAGPASNIAKALYFVASEGEVLETEDCENVIGERSSSRAELKTIQMYPNPSTGLINIYLEEDAEIDIINQVGIVLKTYKLGSGSHSLDLNLPSGVYFVRDGKSINEKLLIAK